MPPTTIDPAVFADLQATAGTEFVIELVDTFLEEAPQMLAELPPEEGGGIRLDELIRAAPPDTVDGTLRVTEQGETLSQSYGLKSNALRTLGDFLEQITLASDVDGWDEAATLFLSAREDTPASEPGERARLGAASPGARLRWRRSRSAGRAPGRRSSAAAPRA